MQGSSSVVVDTIEGQPWLAIVAQYRGKHSPARLRGATSPPKPAPATDAQRRSASGGFPPSDLAADLVRSNCLSPDGGRPHLIAPPETSCGTKGSCDKRGNPRIKLVATAPFRPCLLAPRTSSRRHGKPPQFRPGRQCAGVS